MNRLKQVEIAGKQFSLNFSTKAANMVDEKFGGIEKLGGIFSADTVSNTMSNLVWLLHLLMEQGAAYHKIIDEEEIQLYTLEELEVLIGIIDLETLQYDLLDAVGLGMKSEVEVETDTKNGETTQVN